MPLRNVATTFTIEQQRLEINALAGDVNNIATGVTNVGTAATANALAAGATGEDLTLSGTLTVNGTQTILNTATLEVEDKNIVIAKGSTTDAAASGGGITLKGANDKTISYNQTGDKWESNKPFEASNLLYNSGNQTITGTGDAVLTVTGPGHSQLSLTNTSGTDHCSINFGDSADIDAGEIRYTNSSDTLYVETAGQIALSIDSNQDASFVGQINVESQGTYFKSNQLKFNPSGTAYIDHGVTSNDIVFRLSNSSALDTNTLTLKSDGYAEFTGANDLRVTLGSTGTAGENSSNWIRASGADFMYNAASGQHKWEIGGTEVATLTADKFQTSQVWDGRGHLRRLSPVAPAGVYDVVAGDNGTQGRYVFTTNNVRLVGGMTAGDMITIINNGGSDITIDAATNSVTLTNSADASTGDRTLASKGMATVLYVGSATAFISGAGLS